MAEPTVKTKYLTFNVGVRYAIALSEAASRVTGKECGIQDAMNHYFFENPKDVRLWSESLFLAVNVQREVDGLPQMTVNEFMDIVDRIGVTELGSHFMLLAKSFTELNGKQTEDQPKKKVSTGLRLMRFLRLRAK